MFGDFQKITCGDGSVRFVLKRIEDIGKAFSLYAPEIDFNFKASLHIAQNIAEGSGQGELKKKSEQIFQDLDRIHIDAVQKFAMAYTTFMVSPCDESAYKNLIKTVNQIYESIDKLRGLETDMRNLNKKTLGPASNKIATNIDNYIKDLTEFYKHVG